MKEREYNIKVTVYATKTITVDALSFQEACEIAETKMNNQIYNYRVEFNYEFEESDKKEKEDNYYDEDYNYRYEHEQGYLDDDDDDEDDIYRNYN